MALHRLLYAGLLALPFSIIAGAAFADAIDGTWCANSDKRQITIAGPSAILPGGKRITGDYSRHSFAYVLPLPALDAGHRVIMRLLGETSVTSFITGPDGTNPSPPELWTRCEQIS